MEAPPSSAATTSSRCPPAVRGVCAIASPALSARAPSPSWPPTPTRASGWRPCARATRAPMPRLSGACTSCCCARRASRCAGARPPRARRARAARRHRPPGAPTTRSSRCWPSSTASGARAASPRGPTSSRCSRPASRCAAAPGRARDRPGAPRAGPRSPTPAPRRGPRRPDGGAAGRLGEAIATALTPHQREVLVAITLDGVPIDVLAERLRTTRGALYKTLHDARRRRARTWPRAAWPRPPRPRDLAMSPDEDLLAPARVLGPAGPELTCEECFEHLDHHVELVLAGADAEAAVPEWPRTSRAVRPARRTTRA